MVEHLSGIRICYLACEIGASWCDKIGYSGFFCGVRNEGGYCQGVNLLFQRSDPLFQRSNPAPNTARSCSLWAIASVIGSDEPSGGRKRLRIARQPSGAARSGPFCIREVRAPFSPALLAHLLNGGIGRC